MYDGEVAGRRGIWRCRSAFVRSLGFWLSAEHRSVSRQTARPRPALRQRPIDRQAGGRPTYLQLLQATPDVGAVVCSCLGWPPDRPSPARPVSPVPSTNSVNGLPADTLRSVTEHGTGRIVVSGSCAQRQNPRSAHRSTAADPDADPALALFRT